MELSDKETAFVRHIDNQAEERGLVQSVLCAGCKHGQVMRRRGKLDVFVWCDSSGMGYPRDVPADIAECTGYEAKNVMSVYTMADIALDVDGREGVNDKAYL